LDRYEATRDHMHATYDGCSRKQWPVRISLALCVVAQVSLLYLAVKIGTSNPNATYLIWALATALL
jgi:hypothetical protein